MQLSAFEWLVICTVLGVLFAIAVYFIKKTMDKQSAHDTRLSKVERNMVGQDDFKALDKEVNHIKQTYVTTDQLREVKTEINGKLDKLEAALADIKDNSVPKDDFYRITLEHNQKLGELTRTIIKHFEKGN